MLGFFFLYLIIYCFFQVYSLISCSVSDPAVLRYTYPGKGGLSTKIVDFLFHSCLCFVLYSLRGLTLFSQLASGSSIVSSVAFSSTGKKWLFALSLSLFQYMSI